MQLMSPTMQHLVSKQAQYYDECSGLSTLMEGHSDDTMDAALKQIDATWRTLVLAQKDASSNASDAFTLIAGKHMQPSHRLWMWMGGMRVTVLLRAFLGMRTHAIMSAETRSALLRHVECWHIQEEVRTCRCRCRLCCRRRRCQINLNFGITGHHARLVPLLLHRCDLCFAACRYCVGEGASTSQAPFLLQGARTYAYAYAYAAAQRAPPRDSERAHVESTPSEHSIR